MRNFHKIDYEMLKSWYEERGAMAPPYNSLPVLGIIVPEIAAGFLATTDSDICFLEGFISNPKSLKEERDLVLDEITDQLLERASEMGFKNVLVLTSNPAIEERARQWGFSNKGLFKLMHRELD